MRKQEKGFTLIELIIVIVILGVLAVVAAPRFVDFTDDAHRATVSGTAAAFEQGVKQVHYAWLIRGNKQAVQDFIPISDSAVGGDLSVNEYGYPADTRGTSLTLSSDNDCLDVWRAVLATQDASVENDDSAMYTATYDGDFSCTYDYNAVSGVSVMYNSQTGEVTTTL